MKTFFRMCGIAAVCAGFLAACGNGGGGGGGGSAAAPTTLSGVFADSPVAGLTYVIGGVSAKTDANGRFNYKAGDSITFRVGDIVLGTAIGKPFLSPVSLVPGATDETNATVTNLAKFLQTIDDNNNPADGIVLTNAIHAAAVGRTINFAQATGVFDADFAVTSAYTVLTTASAAGVHAGVSDANARAHFRNTLLQRIAGTYNGTYSGGMSGTFTFTADNTGAITSGQIVQPAPFPVIAITGNVASGGAYAGTGAATIGGVPININLTGTVSVDASTVSGAWNITNLGGTVLYAGSFGGGK